MRFWRACSAFLNVIPCGPNSYATSFPLSAVTVKVVGSSTAPWGTVSWKPAAGMESDPPSFPMTAETVMSCAGSAFFRVSASLLTRPPIRPETRPGRLHRPVSARWGNPSRRRQAERGDDGRSERQGLKLLSSSGPA